MSQLLLTPQSLQYLAQTILAGVLSCYLFARSPRPSATRELASFFACLTAGLLLLCLDSALVARAEKVCIDAAPAVFQVAGVFLLAFAYRFPNASPGVEARWVVRAAWLLVAADLVLAGPNLLRSWRGEPNPVVPSASNCCWSRWRPAGSWWSSCVAPCGPTRRRGANGQRSSASRGWSRSSCS